MSLLNAMDKMMTNEVAVEAANEDYLFNLEYAMEADENIDIMVDGKDEISAMVDEDEEEDEINNELDAEECGTCESLTGKAFLDSLNLDTDDPIKTENGSIGQKDSAPSFSTNFSDEAADNNDPIKTQNGSIGQKDSVATFDKNFSDEEFDKNDPIDTANGSIGQKDSVAKDPTMESMTFFGELLDEEVAMEGLIQKYKDHRVAKNTEKRSKDLAMIGVTDIDHKKLQELVDAKKSSQALALAKKFNSELEKAKSKISEDDPDAKKKVKIINKYLKTNSCLMVGLEYDKRSASYKENGSNKKAANEQAVQDILDRVREMGNPAYESLVEECLGMIVAFEAENDPEATTNGSIGQKDSAATFDKNFTDGADDNNDPIKTKDGSEGQEDSAATFDKNFSDGLFDESDPIKTKDGSVGQKDSTAKDPASESYVEDELDILNDSIFDDFTSFLED